MLTPSTPRSRPCVPVQRGERAVADRRRTRAPRRRRAAGRRTGCGCRTDRSRRTAPTRTARRLAPSRSASRFVRRGGALLGGVRPVLDAHHGVVVRIEQPVVPACAVTGGVDARRARPQRRVADDAVAELQAARRQPLDRRCDADADDDHVRVDQLAGRRAARPHTGRRRPRSRATCTPQRRSTPCRSCTAATAVPISAPSPRISGAVSALEHGHLAAERAAPWPRPRVR